MQVCLSDLQSLCVCLLPCQRIFLRLSHMDLPGPDNIFANCAGVGDLLSRIGDKWVVQVIVVLANAPERFNSLKRKIPSVSQQMLTRTLRALESDGLVHRSVRETRPPQTEYALTPLGTSLARHLRELAGWAIEHRGAIRANRERYENKYQSE